MKHTLITGASGGLGRELAVECARRGHNLILFSLPDTNVSLLAKQITTEYKVNVVSFEFDQRDPLTLKRIAESICANYQVNFLINNAGIGGTADFGTTPLSRLDDIIELNVRSTTALVHLLAPHLLRHTPSYILNVASMAALMPIAFKTVYPASKAFISSFSLGLREEYSGTGLSVSVLCPGPIMTNASSTRRILSQGTRAAASLLPAHTVARDAISGTYSGKAVIIPGRMNRIGHFVMGWLPLQMKTRLISKAVKKEMAYTI